MTIISLIFFQSSQYCTSHNFMQKYFLIYLLNLQYTLYPHCTIVKHTKALVVHSDFLFIALDNLHKQGGKSSRIVAVPVIFLSSTMDKLYGAHIVIFLNLKIIVFYCDLSMKSDCRIHISRRTQRVKHIFITPITGKQHSFELAGNLLSRFVISP